MSCMFSLFIKVNWLSYYKQSIKFYTGKYKIVRIHVERIMGVLKQKFTFYETLYQYQIIDKIVCVCVCALINLHFTKHCTNIR